MDVFTWAAIAIVLGPVIAGLAIPLFRWLFADLTRLLVVGFIIGGIYLYWYA